MVRVLPVVKVIMYGRHLWTLGAPALLFVLVATAPAAAQVRYLDEIFPKISTVRDLAYGPDERHVLDLYRPGGDSENSRPAIVWVHGGSFCAGDKGSGVTNVLARSFARRGWVAASINYRLGNCLSAIPTLQDIFLNGFSPEIRNAQNDLQAAVRWLRSHANQYGINPERIVVGGNSAGAITALFAHFNADRPGDSGFQADRHESSATLAAVSIAGGMDPRDVDLAAGPILLFHGTNDLTVPYLLGFETCVAGSAAGNYCQLETYPGDGHSIGASRRGEILEESATFLCQNVLTDCCEEAFGVCPIATAYDLDPR